MLWLKWFCGGENVGKLEEQRSYFLKNFVIREYGCSHFLGFDRDGSEITVIPDIASVQQVDGGDKV